MVDRPRILIVDDDPLVIGALCAFLDLQGDYEAIGCRCPLAALQRVASEPIDLVIADHLMPAMNGVQLLTHIAEHFPAVPRVLLTGCCGQTDGTLREGLGPARLSAYLEKPWDNTAVERLLQRLLPRPGAVRVVPTLTTGEAGSAHV